MATLDIGKIKFTWKGTFATGTTYEADDVVYYNGDSWVYVNATSKTGTAAGAPASTNTTHWNLMAQGTSNTLTTAGDLLTHDGSTVARLAIGNAGQVLKATSSTAVGWGTADGWQSMDICDSNVPLYANTTNSTIPGTDGKRPWLAQYNGKSGASADWIPIDPFFNPECGPVKRDRERMHNNYTKMVWLNSSHELMTKGYSHYGLGAIGSGSYNESVEHCMPISTEFGGLKDGEYFVRHWYNQNSMVVLTNKGNVFVQGENGSGQLGLGDTTDRYQLVRNPYLGPDATNNSITCEVACVATNDAGGYQGMGNTHYFFITHDGRVFVCGWGGSGSHGLGNTTNTNVPTRITGLSNIVSISAGYSDTYFLDSSGNAYHTGSNTNSISSLGSSRTSPAQMTAVSNAAQIMCCNTYYYNGGVAACGYYINTSGDLYAIGNNGSGQCATGNTTTQTAWVQVGGSENFAAIHSAGNASTLSLCAFLGNPSGQDGPGDAYTYTVAANTGLQIAIWGYNGQGQHLVGNTTANQSVRDPQTTTFGTNYLKNVTSSADGSINTTNLTFPKNNIKAIFPIRSSGYNAPGWIFLDTQYRTWNGGYFHNAYYYQANTSSYNFTNAFLYPAPWNHSLASGFHYPGTTDIYVKEIMSVGHYYNSYWTWYARMSDNSIWMIGNNYYYQHGSNNNTHFRHWHKMQP